MGSALPGCDLVLQLVDRVTTDKSPIHFDIEGPNPEDFEKIVAQAERLGGTIVEYVEEAGYTLKVMADPDGNEFCVNRVPSGIPAGNHQEAGRDSMPDNSMPDNSVPDEAMPARTLGPP